MKRFSEYSFKDPAFSLGDIGTFKCEVIKQLAIAIDDILFPDDETWEDKHTSEQLTAFLYEIRGKAEEIDELMQKLDRELGEMGVGYYKSWKKEEPKEESQPEAVSVAA